MSRIADFLARVIPVGTFRDRRFQRGLLAAITVTLVAVPLVLQAPPVGLTEGEPAPRTFRANRTVQFVDETATEAARRQAAAAIEPVTVFDTEVVATGRQQVASVFVAIRAQRPTWSEEPTAALGALATRLPDYDAEWFESLLRADDTEFSRAERAAEQLAGSVLGQKFAADEQETVEQQLSESAKLLPLSEPVRQAVENIVRMSVRPTLSVDEKATEAARAAASEAVAPVVVIKQLGENIVQRGEIVTAEQLEIIRRLGLLEQGGSLSSLLALTLLSTLAMAAAVAYMRRFERAVYESTRDLALISVLVVGALWITRSVLWFFPEVSVYLLPFPLTAMLATVLINARIGLLTAVVTTIGSVLLGFAGGSSMVVMLVWSMLSVVAMSFMTERSRLFYVGVFLVASGSLLAGLATVAGGASLTEAVSAGANGALGGLFAAVLGYGLLPYFEHVFNITTDIRLTELTSPGYPLMRRLMVEAPGTYSHSVITGNLAEAAAETIGANPLLTRVGAYYHDIGKIRRPGFFVENLAGADNPHDDTTPSLSAIIITAHVREGAEIAREYGLPTEIIDIIEQHHGDSLVSYFYNKAARGDGPVAEADFRYTSSRPQSREAALVMLADSSEAAVRAVSDPTPSRVESAVRRVVEGKVADGQLQDSELTLADLDRIVRVYSKMLVSIYHPRIEYPESVPRRLHHAH
ncbi:MAG: HDIG domain-containing protein [Coriobacteriia bacterium]|jgi:putative nucleotidyltransferase with HDIG domain|nr:HDIG domain-containing protein [Coriobacteriia bacterium]